MDASSDDRSAMADRATVLMEVAGAR